MWSFDNFKDNVWDYDKALQMLPDKEKRMINNLYRE